MYPIAAEAGRLSFRHYGPVRAISQTIRRAGCLRRAGETADPAAVRGAEPPLAVRGKCLAQSNKSRTRSRVTKNLLALSQHRAQSTGVNLQHAGLN